MAGAGMVQAAGMEASASKPWQPMQGLVAPFEANGGQFDERVAFMARTFAGPVFVTRQGQVVYSLSGAPASPGMAGQGRPAVARKPGWTLVETLAGARPLAPQGGELASTQVSRFQGPRAYHAATYRNLQLGQAWPGIAVELAARGGNVEKLFHVAPRADAAQIQVLVGGARSLRLGEAGELIAATGHGDLVYTAPVAFQEVAGRRVDVPVQYALNARQDGYGFVLGAYDAALPLVIDPLLQSTYLGSSGNDQISPRSLVIDQGTGDVLVAGQTGAADFPGTAGGAQPAYAAYLEGFVARVSGDLKTLRQASYLGGSSQDIANGLAIDGSTGDVIVVGETVSADFPGVAGGAQPVLGGFTDAFVTRLSADLRTLRRSSFLGGPGSQRARGVAIDAGTGDVIVAGQTDSPGFPATAGAGQPGPGGGSDGFVARLSGDLTTLRRSSYLGGSGDDEVFTLAIHPGSKEVVLAGVTVSADFPGVAGGADPAFNSASYKGFVSRLSPDLTLIRQSTYIGGTEYDAVAALAIDAARGDVLVAGQLASTDLPNAAGGAQASHGGGGLDGFVSRLSGDLKILRQSTYLGGDDQDVIEAIAIDGTTGDVVVGGGTYSQNFPGTDGGISSGHKGGVSDSFVSRLTGDLKTVKQSTYLSGNNFDYGSSLAIDARTGDVLISGYTSSSVFGGTDGGAQASYAGADDGFIARLTGDFKAVSPQTILFPPQASRMFVAGDSFAINPPATASSGLAVAYASSTPGICTVSGSTVTMVAMGMCTLVASQAGDAGWEPAANVQQSVALVGAAAVAAAIPTLGAAALAAMAAMMLVLAAWVLRRPGRTQT